MGVEDEARMMMKEMVRLFFTLSEDVVTQINDGIKKTKEFLKTRKYKDEKGVKIKSKNEFILSERAKNNSKSVKLERQVVKDSNKQLKMLVKECKKKGVAVYIEKCPKNLDALVDKYNNNQPLSIKEQDLITAFTDKDVEGNITNIHRGGGVVVFNAQEIDLVEEAVKDVEHKNMNIARRKVKAAEKKKAGKDKAKDITKTLKRDGDDLIK